MEVTYKKLMYLIYNQGYLYHAIDKYRKRHICEWKVTNTNVYI